MSTRLVLLFSQIYIHISFLIGLYRYPLSTTLPLIFAEQVIFVGLCGTVFYHRVVTHKNPVKPFIEKCLILLSWIGCSGSLVAWAGTHRKHHRHSDTVNDPHSPAFLGKIKAYWWSSGNENK